MKCIDRELVIYGDYNSQNTNYLSIQFEKCDPTVRDTCKSDEEIFEWLKRKFIVTVENTNIFRMSVYNETRISFESQFSWYPVFAIQGGSMEFL